MASSSSNNFHHARSNSLPSRPHPVISLLEKYLHSLRASETTCSTSSLTGKLCGLQDLYECDDKLLLLPLVQKAFTQHNTDERWVDELLDGSLRLGDLCSSAKNSLSQTMEVLQELQSSLHRRKGGENVQTDKIRKYLGTRKSVKKAIKKAISSLQTRKDESSSLLNKDDEAAAFVSFLREVESASSAVLESVFLPDLLVKTTTLNEQQPVHSFQGDIQENNSLCGGKSRSERPSQARYGSGVSDQSHRASKVHDLMQVEQLQNSLKNLEIDIQDLEEGLENLYRRLIKTRVSLLNILN